MRESLEFSLPFGGPKVELSWVPMPATSRLHEKPRSAMHCDSGRDPAGCFARGGGAYWSTVIACTLSPTPAAEEFSDAVPVNDHNRMLVLAPKNTASELRKYSVPPWAPSNWLPWAGHTVKPAPSGPSPTVLNSTALPGCPVRRLLPMP